MQIPRIVFPFLFSLLLLAPTQLRAAETPSPLPIKPIPDFDLQDAAGGHHQLSDLPGRLVVVAFLGVECPLAKLYGPRLKELQAKYPSADVSFIGINSNAQDSMTELAAYVRLHEISFPVLKDPGNRVADIFTATRTPEVFVLDEQRRVRYRGRIDDQYGVGYSRERATSHDLRDALDQLLAGEEVQRPATVAVGCYIGRVRKPEPDAEVTYSGQIAALMNKHCVECHREGEIAPFTLTTYDDVSAWAETIAEVVQDQRMPPWHANPEHGEFANARGMTTEEKNQIYDWVSAGAPLGKADEVPPLRSFPEVSWLMGREPDQVVAMRDRPFVVPAQGTVEYQYFVVDPGFEEDKWVRAAEIVPGNRTVVHHAILFIRPPAGERRPGVGWLTAYVPGQSIMDLGEGMARRVPAGSKFIFQMHYTTAGSKQEDVTKVGLVFAEPETVTEEVVTLIAIDRKFEIPPHAQNFPVEAKLVDPPPNGRLLAVAPHMHVRGRSFQVEATDASGKSELLLDVPNYDFNWQHSYEFEQPLPLRDVQIRCRATFDNSKFNLVNPDPSVTVRWGDQTWEEMMIGFFEVALPRGEVEKHFAADPLTAKDRQRAEAKVERLMSRWDADSNGAIAKSETASANAFLVFAFNKMDQNRDGKITRDEALTYNLDEQRRKRRR